MNKQIIPIKLIISSSFIACLILPSPAQAAPRSHLSTYAKEQIERVTKFQIRLLDQLQIIAVNNNSSKIRQQGRRITSNVDEILKRSKISRRELQLAKEKAKMQAKQAKELNRRVREQSRDLADRQKDQLRNLQDRTKRLMEQRKDLAQNLRN